MKNNSISKRSATNLDRFDEMTDEMIDTSEIPPLTAEFFEKPHGIYRKNLSKLPLKLNLIHLLGFKRRVKTINSVWLRHCVFM